MKNNLYNEWIGRISQIEPTPVSAENLTNRILASIENIPIKKQRFIMFPVNKQQWTYFTTFRAILTTAAAFLIGYFIFQQNN